ncbi:MAG TPA: hypothetical protein VFK97_01270, partial [Candidatus Saccharimonadales bacterium]|nr:hypothetical protein [Candidatus Saccharimonadales bacterium]
MDPLKTYINKARLRGHSEEHIRQALITAGWRPEQVESAMSRPAVLPTNQVQPATPSESDIFAQASAAMAETATKAPQNRFEPSPIKQQKAKQRPRLSRQRLLLTLAIVLAVAVLAAGALILNAKLS